MQQKITELQRLCNTLDTMGKFKMYGDDGKSEKLRFYAYKPFATEQATDFVVNCMQKIGFTNVQNDKTKNDFFRSVSAVIVCEYDLDFYYIKNANEQDVRALYNMLNYINIWCNLSVPVQTGKQPIAHWKHKQDILNYLNHVNMK